MSARTLLDKLWDAHEILRRDDGVSLLWFDRHFVHEGSHHAFAKLAARGAIKYMDENGVTLPELDQLQVDAEVERPALAQLEALHETEEDIKVTWKWRPLTAKANSARGA